MEKLTDTNAARVEKAIREAQAKAGLTEIQQGIDSGNVWQMEGAAGRDAMSRLTNGECFLPTTPHKDYWGNRVPSRDDLKPGTQGTLELAAEFYEVK